MEGKDPLSEFDRYSVHNNIEKNNDDVWKHFLYKISIIVLVIKRTQFLALLLVLYSETF